MGWPRRFWLALLVVTGLARAANVEILSADTFEVRPITLPGGAETELLVITGSPVRLRVDGDTIVAEYVEFDRESRVMRIVGAGEVAFDDVKSQGRNYTLDLSSGDLAFKDVLIFTQPLDIKGVEATRLPGQIDIAGGLFSPCSRCAQEVQDYYFRAERMNFYPGDRLVAFNVTVFVKSLPSFFLPLLVIPLGPEAKQPRLTLQRGSDTERAEAALDLPYVFGANAYGATSLRYYADVTRGLSNSPAETILGGTVTQNYFGGGFDHRFFTGRGRGQLEFFLTPDFGGDRGYDYRYAFGYRTNEALAGLQIDTQLSRDDTVSPQIFNLSARLGERYGGFDFRYVTQTYYDLDPNDSSFLPSYPSSEGALHTYGQLQVTPQDNLTFSVGPFTLGNLLLEIGYYEDYANTSNPSALESDLELGGSVVIRAGRLLEQHTLTLEAFSPFEGMSVSGTTSYTGQLYSTVNENLEYERLIDWRTSLSAEQSFGIGSFGIDFSRTVLEGETPFQFDARTTTGTRTDLTSELELEPTDWATLSVREQYVFQDSRTPLSEGAGPLETNLELFGNLDYLDVTLAHVYDIKENDAGLLGADVTLTGEDAVLETELELSGIYDLDQRPNRTDGARVNESVADISGSVGYTPYAELSAELGFDFSAPEFDSDTRFDTISDLEPGADDAGEARFKPLALDLTLGTLSDQSDSVPGLRVGVERDINAGQLARLELEARARVGPLELEAEQNFDFDEAFASANDTSFSLTYPDIIELRATGFTPISPEFVGLTPDPEEVSSYSVSLLDLTQQEVVKLYQLIYTTSYGPFISADGLTEGVGFQDTTLNAQLNVPLRYLSTPLGRVGVRATFDSTLAIADAALPVTYLSDSELALTADFFSRVALQGTLSYEAAYSSFSGEVDERVLTFDDFGFTVRPLDDLYISAVLNLDNPWVFSHPNPDNEVLYPAFTYRPVLYLTYDRCCWALYAALDTENGTFTIGLGYPGGQEGLTGAFEIPALALPRRAVGDE